MKDLMNFLAAFLGPRFLTDAEQADVAVVPNNMTMYRLEALKPAPDRFRGELLTHDIGAFLFYVEEHATLETCIFFDEPASATAILNFGSADSPTWQDHTATLTCRPTPLYAALIQIVGEINQKTLLDFLDDWGLALQFQRKGNSVPLATARQQFADLTLEKIRRSRSNRSENFERELSAAEKLSIGGDLPDSLTVSCAPYEGLQARVIRVAISAAEVGNAPGLELRRVGAKQELEAITAELIAKLKSSNLPVIRGSYSPVQEQVNIVSGLVTPQGSR